MNAKFLILLILASASTTKLSREERMVLCIGDIISELIVAQKEQKDVNLNALKTRYFEQFSLAFF